MKAEGIALVTGASRGIGRATARELANRGFEVVAAMRNPRDGAELEREAVDRSWRLRVERLDVTDPDSIRIPERLRVLVNNAGIEAENQPVEHASLESWREIFETNVFGLVEVTRRAIPALRGAGGGVICNITSCSTLVPMPFFGVYRASKAAVGALGETLRTELAPFGIRVVEIMPGAIETDMLAASQQLPEGAAHAGYGAMGERVRASRQQGEALTTAADCAAAAIVDAILDDRGPLRNSCDPMGAALLGAWRDRSDEDAMRPIVALFATPDLPGDD